MVHKSTCFGQLPCPSPGVIYCTIYTVTFYAGWNILILQASGRQTCTKCATADCTVDNSWLWARKLPETCRFVYQKIKLEINASVGFIEKEFITKHGHMNIKLVNNILGHLEDNSALMTMKIKSQNYLPVSVYWTTCL